MSARSILALVCFLAFARVAAAGSGGTDLRRLYLSASNHFDLGEYAAALTEFKELYRLKNDPVLLYNIAQCARLLGKSDDALRSYRVYLMRSPNAPNRAEVEGRIAALEAALRNAPAPAPQPDPGVAAARPAGAARSSGDAGAARSSGDAGAARSSGDAGAAKLGVGSARPDSDASTTLVKPATPVERKRTPLYKKWWLWTAVGGVVVAGAAVGLGVALSSHGPPQFPALTF
jgi:tetratricopeptide (TPR) repeat protein